MNVKTREFISLTERNRKRNSNIKILDNLIKYGIKKKKKKIKEKKKQTKKKKKEKMKMKMKIPNK